QNAAEQQNAAAAHRNSRDQLCNDAGEEDDRHDLESEPAIIDEKAAQPADDAAQCVHCQASAEGRRFAATAAIPVPRNTAANATMARSEPGQATPRPSPVQNTPNADSMTPTANLRVFSGTRASGRRTANPTPTTSRHAATAPALAGMSDPRPAPTAITMKTTSRPSSSTALNAASAASQ